MLSSKKRTHSLDIWPGFVDALSTVLMVIIFVLMTFVLAQLYLTEALNTKDEHVSALEQRIDELTSLIQDKTAINSELKTKSQTLDTLVEALNSKLQGLTQEASVKDQKLQKTLSFNQELLQETETLKTKIHQLLNALQLHIANNMLSQQKIESLLHKMDKSFLSQLENLDEIEEEKNKTKTHIVNLEAKLKELEERGLKEREELKNQRQFDYYRSEFFSKLLKILGNRSDIRIVGDRFVFQSEVLFDTASAQLGERGAQGLDGLVTALLEISKIIPHNISWILRIDGHTDRLPIKSPQFPSNWELSAARSIAVVKYLISKGIPQERLVAAGFGEHQPLTKGDSDTELARNRRIEFKLDQK